MIRLSEHSFGPGEATTTLHTNWVQEIGSTTNPLGAPKKVSGDGSSPDICIQNEKPTPKADLGRSLGDLYGDVVEWIEDTVGYYFDAATLKLGQSTQRHEDQDKRADDQGTREIREAQKSWASEGKL